MKTATISIRDGKGEVIGVRPVVIRRCELEGEMRQAYSVVRGDNALVYVATNYQARDKAVNKRWLRIFEARMSQSGGMRFYAVRRNDGQRPYSIQLNSEYDRLAGYAQ